MISIRLKPFLILTTFFGVTLAIAISHQEKADLQSVESSEQIEVYSVRDYFLFISGREDQPTYRLSINEGYISSHYADRIALLTSYPGMDFARPDNRSNFFLPSGLSAGGAVRITIDIADASVLDSSYTYRNSNDAGRFAIENTVLRRPSYSAVATDSAIKSSDRVSEYKHVRDQPGDRRLVITHPDTRISYVECLGVTQCKAFTTWEGELRIRYFFSADLINDVVELDAAIFSLIDTFSPTPI